MTPHVIERHGGGALADKAALTGDETITYAELRSLVRQVSGWATASGLAGRPVAVALPPGPGSVVLLLGLMEAGAIACPCNTRLPADEQQHYLAGIGATLLLSDGRFAAPPGTSVVELDVDDHTRPLGARLPSAAHVEVEVDETSAAIAFPTGGTTGPPKSVVWSHRGLLLALESAIDQLDVRADDVELYVSPMFHVTIVTGLLSTLCAGGTVQLSGLFDHERVARTLGAGTISRLFATPAALERLLPHACPAWRSVRRLGFGASRSMPDLPHRLARAFPAARLYTGYGATEFGAVVRLHHTELLAGGFGVGQPVPGAEVRVVDDTGVELAPGAEGELVVRAPWQMLGHLVSGDVVVPPTMTGRRPSIRSGDLGTVRTDGFVELHDRIGDIIKPGGEKVLPSAVEAVLREVPEVDDVVVFGVDDSRTGERVEAAVVWRGSGAPDADLLRRVASGRLASYAVPRSILFVERIPLTPNMKPDRRALRSERP